MKYYSPVFNIFTDTKYYEFSKYLFIELTANSDFKLQHEFFLSLNDRYEINSTKYWFVVNENIPKYLSSSQALNILLLSFWILSPTEIHLKYKLKSDDSVGLFLDRFLFNKYEGRKTNYTFDDFSEIKTYYTSLIKIFKTNKRLSLALDNTYRACTTYNWKVAFLLLTNALESMFTYSREKGITRRLAKSYACFMTTDKKNRDNLFREFYNLYHESDIQLNEVYNYVSQIFDNPENTYIQSINLGIGAQNPHSNDEFIMIEDLIKTAEIAIELIKK